MLITSLTAQLSTILLDLYGISTCPNFDWHPALHREGAFYQSSLCDRMSDQLKISPASLARSLQDRLLAESDFRIEIDNRGYLYVQMAQIQFDWQIISPKKVYVYIQPPSSEKWSLYYLKFVSFIGMQLELLRIENIETFLFVPGANSEDNQYLVLNGSGYFGKEGFRQLINLLNQRAHVAALSDLANFGQSALNFQKNDSVVLWVSTELLSLPNVAAAFSSLQQKLANDVNFNIRSAKFEALPNVQNDKDFNNAFKQYGSRLLLYLCELEHALDLDWQTPEFENWLSIGWLAKSLRLRLETIDTNIEVDIEVNSAQLIEAKFLLSNIDFMQRRAAILGDFDGYLQGLRKVLTNLHTIINKRQVGLLRQLNIPASFTQKISSIIEGF